jgi:hypothetical protein
MYKINAAFRLFASNSDEAGKALKAIATVLGPNFLLNEHEHLQAIVWRSSLFKAALVLDTQTGDLSLNFRDKNNAAGFEAEGRDLPSLLKDIRYNVSEFKPTKPVDPQVQKLLDKFEVIK